ncbi:MAG: type II toxin-antitoxin system PemK/MazF family toxin [Candidatus Eremiobacteraeota bacterium]|nr:type II toxin-antitoxin system PemK/MazF family toxin [Candidatus Eremiobacteraeota bacterium]MCW5872269.1 type II toxin-antitoxin system PemK/MazF family toxin [Candidatus Eremiobacteraeota bacterium]
MELVNPPLDPTRGSEIQKTRPCLVVSPDEMNRHLLTVKDYPTRVPVHFQGQDGKVALDRLRTVDRTRLVRQLGRLQAQEASLVLACLGEMFAE